MESWNRQQVSYCRCSELKYVHAHCPCYNCNGKAVSRATEYRHWVEANLEGSCNAHAQLVLHPQDNNMATESNESTGTIDDSISTTFVLASQSPCTNDSLPAVSSPDISGIDPTVSTPNISDELLQLQSTDKTSNICQSTFGEDIENDIAIAVLRAFAITDDIGGLQKNMLQILEFGRDCYCKGNYECLKTGLVLGQHA